MTVVGVMRSVHTADVEGNGNPVGSYYMPYAQNVGEGMRWRWKTRHHRLDPAKRTRHGSRPWRAGLALFDVHTMEERGDLALASRRASLTLALFFRRPGFVACPRLGSTAFWRTW